jgi:chromosome segregation protein
VIFNGTRTRKPLGLAEVHLTLSNEDRSLPVEYSEITVARKIYRDGGSEYYVNGELARLKDIRGLLVDTGLGNHTYSIIEREMVDSVISEKDQDKRFLLEEAAGVMRYRIQREEALRKIEQTETDLTRLADILAELDKEIRSLRYQMAKARRYSRLREKLGLMESALVRRSLFELLNETDEFRREKAHHEGITLAGDNEITVREDRLAEERIEGSEIERRLQDLYEGRHDLSRLLQQHEERIAILNERIASNENRIIEDKDEIDRANAKLATLGRELEQYRQLIDDKEGRLTSGAEELFRAEERLRAVSRELDGAGEEIRGRKQLVLDLVKERERVRGTREHLEERLRELAEKTGRSDEEIGALRCEQASARARLEQIRGEESANAARIETLQSAADWIAARSVRAASALARCDDVAAKETIALHRFTEKAELLRKIKSEHARGGDELLSTGGRIKGLLADRVRVEKQYRRCFEACLAPVLQSLLTESREDAVKCVDDIRGTAGGKVHLLYPSGNGESRASNLEHPAIGTAREFLAASDGVLDYLGEYLSDVVVTKDMAGALQLLETQPGCRVATLDGVFFDGPGRIVVAGSDDIAMTLLDLESKLEELAEWTEKSESRLERLRDRKTALGNAKLRIAERSADLRGKLGAAEEKMRSIEEKRSGCEVDVAVLEERLAVLSSSRADCERELEATRAKLDATPEPPAEQADEAGSGDIADLEGRALELEREKETRGGEAAKLRVEMATLAGEVTTAREKRKNAEMLESELRELVSFREVDAGRCENEVASARTEIAEGRERIVTFHASVDRTEKEIEEAKAALEENHRRCELVEADLKTLKDEREHKRENIQRCAVEIATRETRINDLIEKARESLGMDFESYVRDRTLFAPADWESLDETALAELRRTVDGFGPVNMLAIDEFNEKHGRFEFLSRQKSDLEEAKASLNQAIRRINAEARRRISETFDQVRSNFKATFLTLFDGGEADMLFVESDDPLEAKIRLVANPKGKRLQDISSLSGGERALVALSLLFAIYLVKPSPFCVFDEVDAPLDDANVSRFTRLLKSFTDRTQFIVITHNKKTMEAADSLYGVTMEEPGVSKMISVHIGEVDRFRERRAPRDSAVDAREAEPART